MLSSVILIISIAYSLYLFNKLYNIKYDTIMTYYKIKKK
ncbi:hypothetical protein CLD_3536 [Clostridium botulinum B1 str. Okra]|uniref:Uncharacterized protein n=1 Tax=Clostridium botulinum (strain Okra / Type B1) TaxID=498213 RepID=B1II97_CLOBK|nr:hypothetical protein CLD_3536 [Clostridium botulinum B1 str. Okra]